jgi:hypothetical protein
MNLSYQFISFLSLLPSPKARNWIITATKSIFGRFRKLIDLYPVKKQFFDQIWKHLQFSPRCSNMTLVAYPKKIRFCGLIIVVKINTLIWKSSLSVSIQQFPQDWNNSNKIIPNSWFREANLFLSKINHQQFSFIWFNLRINVQ